MHYEKFRVSGMHIWLRDPNTMLCTAATVPVTRPTTTTVATSRTQATVDIAIESQEPISLSNSLTPNLCVIMLTILMLVL